MIEVFNKKFQPYLKAESIQEQVEQIAGRLNQDYEGLRPIFIAI